MCLLVTPSDSGLSQLFATSSLLAAVFIGLWSAVHDVASRIHVYTASTALLVAFILSAFQATTLGSGKIRLRFQ